MQDDAVNNDQISIKIALLSGVWCKQMNFKQAGAVMHGHTHKYNHITLLAKGSLNVTVNNVSTEFRAPHMIFIHKDHEHELRSLEDDTVAYCIHAVREKYTGEIVDELAMPDGVDIEGVLTSMNTQQHSMEQQINAKNL